MAAITNITGVTQVDDSVILAYDQAFMLAVGQDDVMSQFVQYKQQIGAKSIAITKYPRLAAVTAALDEDDADESLYRVALTDSRVTFTPAEYGMVVTRTELAALQTGGMVDLAMATLVGENMGHSKNKLATLALEATTNVRFAGGVADENSLAAGNTVSATELGILYNKLARANVSQLPGGYFGFAAHDDVIHDLRNTAAAGDWVDVSKYSDAMAVLKNEIGIYKGFRIVRNNDASYADQAGAGTVDAYVSTAFGNRGLGLAESMTPTIVFSGPFDALQRFANVGWKGAFQYKILDTDAVWKIVSASSIGANAA